MQILHPKNWRAAKGFSNGVAAEGRQVFVAGQVGWNAEQQFASDDFVVQVEQALRNIVEVLAEAGATAEHLVRLTWYVTDKREYIARQSEVGQAYRHVIGRHFPAMALVQVVALVEDRAKVEIEATAVVPTAS
jgi:enamine deaminase RidA (YjgF/YER057c/UK114 family)